MRFHDDFGGSCDRVRRWCLAGLPVLPAAAVLAPRGFLRAGWYGTRVPDAAGHASRLVAHAGRAAAFRCGSMPASLGSALQRHRHRRPARVPVPRLAVRARRRRGRDPAAGGGGAAAPVGVPAGAAGGRGVRHGLDLPGAAAARSDPDHPRVRRLPVRPHRDRSDPLPRQRRRDHRQQHRLHPRRIRPHGLLRRGSRPASAGRVGATFLFRHHDQLRGDADRPHSHFATTGHQAVGDRDVVALRAGGADALLRRQHPHPGQRVLPGAGRRHRRPT